MIIKAFLIKLWPESTQFSLLIFQDLFFFFLVSVSFVARAAIRFNHVKVSIFMKAGIFLTKYLICGRFYRLSITKKLMMYALFSKEESLNIFKRPSR